MKYKIHPLADLIPSMTDEEYQGLKSDIQNNGYRKECPIILYEGKILDGRHRYLACEELGIEPKFEEYKGNSPANFVVSLNIDRRHLTSSQRAVLANDFLPELEKEAKENMSKGGKGDKNLTPLKRSTNKAAELFKTNRQYVSDIKKIQEKAPKEIEHIRQGKKSIQQVKEELGFNVHIGHNSEDDEYNTPKDILDSARNVMGGIDLDPASNDKANQNVKATKYYTKDEDGLKHSWAGNIWLNPPFSRQLVVSFTSKLVNDFTNKKIKQAIVIVNNATETQWFQKLLSVCTAVCFPKGRVRFHSINKKESGPLQGQAILYFGNNNDKFNKEFKKFGTILWKEE